MTCILLVRTWSKIPQSCDAAWSKPLVRRSDVSSIRQDSFSAGTTSFPGSDGSGAAELQRGLTSHPPELFRLISGPRRSQAAHQATRCALVCFGPKLPFSSIAWGKTTPLSTWWKGCKASSSEGQSGLRKAFKVMSWTSWHRKLHWGDLHRQKIPIPLGMILRIQTPGVC